MTPAERALLLALAKHLARGGRAEMERAIAAVEAEAMPEAPVEKLCQVCGDTYRRFTGYDDRGCPVYVECAFCPPKPVTDPLGSIFEGLEDMPILQPDLDQTAGEKSCATCHHPNCCLVGGIGIGCVSWKPKPSEAGECPTCDGRRLLETSLGLSMPCHDCGGTGRT